MMRLESPTPDPSNCGLPDGILHQHVGICWRAGYEAGRAEYAAVSEERDRLRAEATHLKADRARARCRTLAAEARLAEVWVMADRASGKRYDLDPDEVLEVLAAGGAFMIDRLLTPLASFLTWLIFRADHVRTPLRLRAGVDY